MVQSQRCNPRPKPGPPQGPLGAPGTPRLRKLCCSLLLSLKMTQRVPWLMLFSHVASCRVDSGRQVHRCGQGQFWGPCSSHSPPDLRNSLAVAAPSSKISPLPNTQSCRGFTLCANRPPGARSPMLRPGPGQVRPPKGRQPLPPGLLSFTVLGHRVPFQLSSLLHSQSS